MKEFIKEYADRVKKLKDELDYGEMDFEVQQLNDEYYEILDDESDHSYAMLEGSKIVLGLITKLKRIHPIDSFSYNYNRDPETHLAERLDLGLHSC